MESFLFVINTCGVDTTTVNVFLSLSFRNSQFEDFENSWAQLSRTESISEKTLKDAHRNLKKMLKKHNTDVTMAVFVTTVLVGDMSAKTHDQTCTSALMQLHLMTNASYRRSGKWVDIAVNNRDYSRSLKQSRFPRPLQAGNPPYKSQGPSSVSCGALFTGNRIPLYRSTVNL